VSFLYITHISASRPGSNSDKEEEQHKEELRRTPYVPRAIPQENLAIVGQIPCFGPTFFSVDEIEI
jgi:hypothetical protein